jgi:hypothetical protein
MYQFHEPGYAAARPPVELAASGPRVENSVSFRWVRSLPYVLTEKDRKRSQTYVTRQYALYALPRGRQVGLVYGTADNVQGRRGKHC